MSVQVAAAHPRVAEAEAAEELVDRAAAAECRLERVGRVVVRLDQHPAQERVEIGAGLRLARMRAQRLDGDRDLQRRGGGKARPRVPGRAAAGDEVLDDRRRSCPGTSARAIDGGVEPPVADARDCARARRARQPDDVLDARRSAPAVRRVGRHPDRRVPPRQGDAEVEARRPRRCERRASASPARTTTAHSPLGTRPATGRTRPPARRGRDEHAAAEAAAGCSRSARAILPSYAKPCSRSAASAAFQPSAISSRFVSSVQGFGLRKPGSRLSAVRRRRRP